MYDSAITELPDKPSPRESTPGSTALQRRQEGQVPGLAVRFEAWVHLGHALEVQACSARATQVLAANPDVLTLNERRLEAPLEPLRWRSFLNGQFPSATPTQAQANWAASRRHHGVQAISLVRPGRWPLMVLAMPLPRADAGQPAGLAIELRDPHARAVAPSLLSSLFGLTPAEARVASALSAGATPSAMALTLGIKPNTVNAHIKQLLQKTGTARQAECVSLILLSVCGLPDLMSAP